MTALLISSLNQKMIPRQFPNKTLFLTEFLTVTGEINAFQVFQYKNSFQIFRQSSDRNIFSGLFTEITRMHSNMMCTVPLQWSSAEGVSARGGCLPGGESARGCLPRGCLPGGVCAQGGCLLKGGCLPREVSAGECTPRPSCGQTDTCENITFPQILLQTVKSPVERLHSYSKTYLGGIP